MGGGYLKLKDTNTQKNTLDAGTLEEENLVGVYIQNGDDYEKNDTVPESGYILNEEKSYCKIGDEVQDVTITYDVNTKMLSVSPITKEGTKCYLYFDEYSQLLIEAVEEAYANNTTTLAYDDYDNLRYIGENPNNYVWFNDELWRIIGIFSEDTHGVAGTELIKIIRDESIGTYSWDNSRIDLSSTNGSNDWSDSRLQVVLNEGAYWNRTSGTCPYGSTGAQTNCDFSSTGLTEEAKSLIETVTWQLGGTASYTSSSNGLTSHWYNYERGTEVYRSHATEWKGEVGLVYPSDYGYATSGGTTTDRETCLATELYHWRTSNGMSDCYNNDWLFNDTYQWTLTPYSSNSYNVFTIYSSGYVYIYNASSALGVRPSVYLTSEVLISNGDGTRDNPYLLKL